MLDEIDEVNFCMERRIAARHDYRRHRCQKRNVLGFERVSSGAEEIERLTIVEENCFLRFVDYELGRGVEVLAGVLPHECAVVALILDNIDDAHQQSSSFGRLQSGCGLSAAS